jgi:hypothetical protein
MGLFSGYSLYLPDPKELRKDVCDTIRTTENVIVKTIEPSITQYHNKMQTIQQKKIKINKFFLAESFFFTLARTNKPHSKHTWMHVKIKV